MEGLHGQVASWTIGTPALRAPVDALVAAVAVAVAGDALTYRRVHVVVTHEALVFLQALLVEGQPGIGIQINRMATTLKSNQICFYFRFV